MAAGLGGIAMPPAAQPMSQPAVPGVGSSIALPVGPMTSVVGQAGPGAPMGSLAIGPGHGPSQSIPTTSGGLDLDQLRAGLFAAGLGAP